MAIWALADLHLSFGVPDKKMDFFGDRWTGHAEKIQKNWTDNIRDDDLVLVAGDISWAMHPEDAKVDLDWIHALPGKKMLIRGNHDYWWTSLSKIQPVLPPSIQLIQNNALVWNDVGIAGSRLWDTPEYGFSQFIDYIPNKRAKEKKEDTGEAEKLFLRELNRLELSLKELPKDVKKRIVMTHYAPIGADLQDSRASKLLEKYHTDICVFGHLHNIKEGAKLFGNKNGVEYVLTACDYLKFMPIKICD